MVVEVKNGEKIFYKFANNDFHIIISERQMNKNPYNLVPDFHKEMEIHICTKGKCSYLINNEVYNFIENTVLIMHPDEVHGILSCPKTRAEKITVFFDCKMSRTIKRESEELNGIHVIHLSDKDMVICNLLLNLASEDMKNERHGWKEIAINSLETVLIILNRSNFLEDNKTVNYSNSLIENIILYIDNHFSESLTLKDISEQFIINPYSLSRLMRKYMGMTFKPYLIHRRIIESCKYLENSDTKIGVIAYQVGFEDISSFSRNFLRVIGTTPTNYKKLKDIHNNKK